MPEPSSSIRVNLSSGEIEIKGTEEFVEKHLARVDEIMELVSPLKKYLVAERSAVSESTTPSDNPNGESDQPRVPEYFGEWMYQFPQEDLTEADKALVAAYFAQQQSVDDDIMTGDVTDALGEVGIELSNASRSLGRLSDERKLVKTRRDGRYQRYKVSDQGVAYLMSLQSDEE